LDQNTPTENHHYNMCYFHQSTITYINTIKHKPPRPPWQQHHRSPDHQRSRRTQQKQPLREAAKSSNTKTPPPLPHHKTQEQGGTCTTINLSTVLMANKEQTPIQT
jgi:hypothetical protein